MKKKLIVAISLILLLAISVTVFVGCDAIITRNDERDMLQKVATVKYEGQEDYVYKFELKSSFDSYAYYYNNYYGMSYEEAADYILRSLAQQKLLVLYAKARVSELKGLEGIPSDIGTLLSDSENNKAIKDSNESLKNSLKTLIQEDITDDNYNSGTTDDVSDDDDGDEEITDAVTVRYESNGGSEVTKQKLQRNKKAKEPTEPTKDGYTFYGWYADANCDGDEWDFDAPVAEDMTLHAKWVEYTAPRTVMPEEEEEDDYDPEHNFAEGETFEKKFFDYTVDEFFEEFKEEDFVDDIKVDEGENRDDMLKDYIREGLTTLKNNLTKNLYKKTPNECYDYYVNNQKESLLTTRLERMIGAEALKQFNKNIEGDIQLEYDATIKRNEESFAASDTAYSSALGSNLGGTYFNPDITGAENSYGFVINILLRLPEDDLKILTDMIANNPHDRESVRIKRNYLLSNMYVKVSNPKYKAEEPVLDSEGNEIDLRDPMTDPKNPYNNVDPLIFDNSYEHKDGEGNVSNNYDQIIGFGKNDDGDYEVQYNAYEHPSMAYLLEEVPAFDIGGKVGIIHQIHNSFKMVNDAADLNVAQRVYWLRKIATAWAYLVGDDTGTVTSSSNNNGLGYLITPEGEDSSYLEDFTSYARELIKSGTGSYYASGYDASNAALFKGAESGGAFAGDQVAFAIADSFIDSASTSGYAGVFVLLNSYTVYDGSLYNALTGNTLDGTGKLPLDYPSSFAKDPDDAKTIKDVIKENIETTRKSSAYTLEVNTMGEKYMDQIVYHKKAYKSLWKDLD